jgi:hypothetical protein
MLEPLKYKVGDLVIVEHPIFGRVISHITNLGIGVSNGVVGIYHPSYYIIEDYPQYNVFEEHIVTRLRTRAAMLLYQPNFELFKK